MYVANAASVLRFGPSFRDPYHISWYERDDVLLVIGALGFLSTHQRRTPDHFNDCIARLWSEGSFRHPGEIQYGDALPAMVEAA